MSGIPGRERQHGVASRARLPLAGGSEGFAQRYPTRPARVAVRFAAGGTPDGMEELASWTGMFAPARTPAGVLARLHEQVRAAVATPAVRERLIGLGVIPLGNAPAEFKPFVAAQVGIVARIVRAAGIESQ